MSHLTLCLLIPIAVHYGLSIDSFEAVDDIFSRVIGPVFAVKKTPHPLSRNTKTLDPRVLNTLLPIPLLRNGTRARKASDLHAPTPDARLQIYENRELVESPKEILDMIPHNRILLDRLLDFPINTVPNFDENVSEAITRTFDQIHEEYVKKIDKLGVPSNISRRASLTIKEVINLGPPRLARIAASYKLDYNRLSKTGVALLAQYYYKDRAALDRSLALMNQLIYGARFHFLYGMELKERYSQNVKYRIGYTFAVLENLIHQFYSIYYAMVKEHGKFNFNFDDQVLDYLKLYERSVSINVEFYEVSSFLRQLEKLRVETRDNITQARQLKEFH